MPSEVQGRERGVQIQDTVEVNLERLTDRLVTGAVTRRRLMAYDSD